MVFADDQAKMKSLSWDLNQHDLYFKRENLRTNTHTWRTPCEDEGRIQGDASTSQGMSKIPSKLLKIGARHEQTRSQHWKESTLQGP